MRCWATKSCSRGKGNLCLHQGWDRLLRGVVWDTWREESEGHRPQWWLTFDTQSPALWPESYCLQLATYQVCDITRASTLSTISGCLESCSCWSFQWGKFLTYEIIYFSNVDGDGGRPCLWPDDRNRGLLEETAYFSCQLSREKKNKAIFSSNYYSDVKMFWQASAHSCIICFIFLVFHMESDRGSFFFSLFTDLLNIT